MFAWWCLLHAANHPDREPDEPLIGRHGQGVACAMQHVNRLSPTTLGAAGQPPIGEWLQQKGRTAGKMEGGLVGKEATLDEQLAPLQWLVAR